MKLMTGSLSLTDPGSSTNKGRKKINIEFNTKHLINFIYPIQYSKLFIFEDRLLISKNHLYGPSLTIPIMSLTEDPCSVKPNNTPAADQAPLDTDHTISYLLDELKNFWKQLPDPMDERILTRLQDLCSITQDTRFDLLNKYKILVNRAGDDFNEIADELIISTGDGHRALYWSIRGSLLAYRISRNTKGALNDISNMKATLNDISNIKAVLNDISNMKTVLNDISNMKAVLNDISNTKTALNDISNTKAVLNDISNAATDLVHLAESRKKQEIMDQTAMEHLSSTLNSMCADVTTLMEKVNTLNLGLSIPTSGGIVQSRVSPIVNLDSASSYNPGEFRLPEDTVYLNTHLCVYIDQHGKLSLSPNSKTGVSLLGLNHIPNKKLIKSLLNRDLIKLSDYITKQSMDFTKYYEWSTTNRRVNIELIMDYVPSKSGQWVLNYVD